MFYWGKCDLKVDVLLVLGFERKLKHMLSTMRDDIILQTHFLLQSPVLYFDPRHKQNYQQKEMNDQG